MCRIVLGSKGCNEVRRSQSGKNREKIVLPSSFTCGDRYMHQQYLDSIALCQRFGHPHLFITMTCNPNWKEIQDNLVNEESPLDRPDLVARVFKFKKDQLIKDLGSEMMFGKLLARTHSIEFQKRGFPHVHIIIWLDRQGLRQMDAETIDKMICAEIPDEYCRKREFDKDGKTKMDDNGNIVYQPELDKRGRKKTDKKGNIVYKQEKNPLFVIVTSFMLHGPCNSTMRCMK